tara:strand:- start:21 stop:245 length:225 start_codon:yes stop_codon:yes gene_type:complete
MLKKGTTVYPSVKGYYNFFYPNIETEIILKNDIEAKLLPFMSGKEPVDNKRLTAYKISDILSGTDKSIVVWKWK